MRTVILSLLVLVSVVSTAPAVAVAQEDQSDCTFPLTRTDATGTDVTVDEEPGEVVTLNPSAAQTMWEIDARDKVVGISEYAFYLDGAENRTNVYPRFGSVQTEAIVELQPDLVLAPNTILNETVEQLRDADLTVFKFDRATSIEFVYEKTELTGRLVGACGSADERVDRMRADVELIEEAVEAVDRPRVLYPLGTADSTIFAAGDETFIHTIIETSGGRNVAAEAGLTGYLPLSDEVVVDRDPEYLVRDSNLPEPPESAAYQNTTAVRSGNVVVLDANYINQPAPRIVEPMKKLTKAMHPEAYERAKFGPPDDSSGDTTPPPSFDVEVSPLNVSTVELYGTIPISANVTNTGGPGSFRARLYTDGGLRRTTTISVGSDETKTVTLRRTFSTVGNHTVRINDESVGTVSVVRERKSGTSTGNESTPTPGTDTRATEVTTELEASETATRSPTPTSTATAAPPSSPTVAGPDADSAETDPAGETATEGPTETRRTTGTSAEVVVRDGQPGFGQLVSIVALLLAGALASRRH